MEVIKKIEPEPPKKFTQFANGKNKILWGYFGFCDEYPIILSIIRRFLKVYDPEVLVTIACREEAKKWTSETISEKEFRESGDNWLEKVEFKTSASKPHILETYLSWLPVKNFSSERPKSGKNGLIITSYPPTGRKLSPEQIKQSENFLAKFGLIATSSASEFEAVAGLESPEIWAAVRDGKPVAVPEYSVGLNLLMKFGGKILQ